MLVAQNRPRNLKWFHAGAMLFGDWGTSRLYVLGLAFFYTAHATPMYLAAMAVIMAVVAWGYSVVCREFPDGGGVYTSARKISPVLAVVGATLLLCDYIVTAALSAVEAFHYFGITDSTWVVGLSVGSLALLGFINWFGARSAGRIALIIAVAALIVSVLIAVLCLPLIPKGLATMSWGHSNLATPWVRWESLVQIMLALSGVEAVANMTGLMVQPVATTAKKTIWPVLAEVIILNFVFGIALCGLPELIHTEKPDYYTHVIDQLPNFNNSVDQAMDKVPEAVQQYRDTAVKTLAQSVSVAALGDTMGHLFAKIASIIFGLLLLSASNTAIVDMISVQFAMARDRELPSALSKLNVTGVPWLAVITAVLAPAAILLLVGSDVPILAHLYAVGVVGAITINLVCCAFNTGIHVSRAERAGLAIVGGLMGLVEMTIVATKLQATVFAAFMITMVLVARFAVRRLTARAESLPEPATGWLAELTGPPLRPESGKARLLLAARGRENAEFAVDLARQRRAVLFAIHVRPLRVVEIGPSSVPNIREDREAQEALGTAALIAKAAGVPFVPIYVTSADVADEILDYAVTFGCDTVIMGKSRRSVLSRTVGGDVVGKVAQLLPEGVSLITRAPGPFSPAETERYAAVHQTPGERPKEPGETADHHS